MNMAVTTSIVIAVKGDDRNLPGILQALESSRDHGAELIFVVAGTMRDAFADLPSRARIVTASDNALVPCLWRDGIRAASARRVALLTSECIPASDWLARVAATDIERWAGIGGMLVNDKASDTRNWAVYLLRYLRFAPPAPGGIIDDIAADNAVYDRDAVLRHPDLMDEGFWEPSFHARFHASGRELLFDPQLLVTHSGTNKASVFVRHRFAHGREYGQSRGSRVGTGKNLVLLLASPLLPILMLCRISARAATSKLVFPLLKSFPFLTLFVLAWAAGEGSGYLSALFGRSKK